MAIFGKWYLHNERPVFELYDLENDSFELKNLSGQKRIQRN